MKDEKYEIIIEQIKNITKDEKNLIANLANISAILFQNLYHITWAGFYLLENNELVLGPFQGKPACIRIPQGKGVCGKCVESGETVIVEDVHKFDGHIACDPDSNSEIVIPLKKNGKIFGVIDLDSYKLNDFNETDKINLETVANIISERCEISSI